MKAEFKIKSGGQTGAARAALDCGAFVMEVLDEALGLK